MSQPSFESVSSPSIIPKKPQLNVYTVMLIIALIALLMACLFLYLEINEYGGFNAVRGRVASLMNPLSNLRRVFWV